MPLTRTSSWSARKLDRTSRKLSRLRVGIATTVLVVFACASTFGLAGCALTAAPGSSGNPGSLQLTTASLPDAHAGQAYFDTLAVSGGTAPFSWSVSPGSLPTGVSLGASNGALTGTPSKTGTFSMTINVSDSSATMQTASKAYSMTVMPAVTPVSITTTSVASGQAGSAYSATLAASGGTTPYSWSISAGTLPGGLSLGQSNGTISGTPTASGQFNFTAKVTDSTSPTPQTATKALNITVASGGNGPQLGANPSSVSFGSVIVGNGNSQTISLTNGGTAAVSISQANVSGAGFSITGLPALPVTINPGKNTTFNAVFTPAASGAVTGSISLVSNAPNSPLAIALSGTGQAATHLLSANPTSLNFNSVDDGSSSSLNVILTNTGNSNVTISAVTPSGAGFSVSGAAGATLTPNQTGTLSVTFAPVVAGAVSGSVIVASNATNSPTIALSGIGIQLSSHTVGLTWTASISTGVVGYNVYRGTVSGGPYSVLDSTPVAADAFTDSALQSGLTYFYVVRSVNGTGTESVNSSEVQATIP